MVVSEATHTGQQARLHTRHAWREESPTVNLRGRTSGSFYAIKAFLPPGTFCQVSIFHVGFFHHKVPGCSRLGFVVKNLTPA